MNLLFVHQNFPGQFKHLAPALVKAGHRVEALGIDGPGLSGISLHRYRPTRGFIANMHPWAADFETKVIRGEACAAAAARLQAGGFTPDIIVANPGWGESLFLKDVWPRARLLALIEFFYAARGLDCDFDPEFANPSLAAAARVRVKNANMLLALTLMDHGICPTAFQLSTVPAMFHDRISVIFDGIDTQIVRTDSAATLTIGKRTLRAGDEVVTFVNRNLEPMRGYHQFMRALPQILHVRPNAVVLIVGGDEVSYGAPPPAGKTWKQIFLDEVKADLDMSRVFFLGRIPYADYLRVLQVSACHVYLTYPFVLGWSCIEAMSAGCVLVGSATPPVMEVIEHQKNGVLVDFF
jgi:glycosyltransferase involved in cell wall biosynthesis